MKILAVDTSTRTCSVALIDDDALIAETTTGVSRTHTKHLMDMIAHTLADAGLGLDHIDALAVVKGPGSFTGLRIGISTVQGLAVAAGKPVAGVSALEALAWQSMAYRGNIYPMIDARRAEVYTAGYYASDGRLRHISPEQVGPPEDAFKCMATPCLILGSGALLYRNLIGEHLGSQAQLAPVLRHHVHASSVAALALEQFEQKGVDKGAAVRPDYLRQSDAEINLQRLRSKSA